MSGGAGWQRGLARGGDGVQGAQAKDLGPMPEWDLSDLYAGPKSQGVADDVERARREAKALRDRYQGRLAGLGRDGPALAEAIVGYENLGELLGRLGSFAGLLYAANTADPERA